MLGVEEAVTEEKVPSIAIPQAPCRRGGGFEIKWRKGRMRGIKPALEKFRAAVDGKNCPFDQYDGSQRSTPRLR